MKNIYNHILENKKENRKLLAVLLDPDQCRGSLLASTIAALKSNVPDFIFVGGSHILSSTDSLIELLKEETKAAVVLFPGRNAEFLIGQHITSALAIKNSNIEVIPTGYLLVDGGKPSSVEYISNTRPIPRDKNEIALSTSVAAELLGMKLIYLEAGSGANHPVTPEMIETVNSGLSIPLIVGGGIKTTTNLRAAFEAGADLVVVGNIFESNPSLIADFVQCKNEFNQE